MDLSNGTVQPEIPGDVSDFNEFEVSSMSSDWSGVPVSGRVVLRKAVRVRRDVLDAILPGSPHLTPPPWSRRSAPVQLHRLPASTILSTIFSLLPARLSWRAPGHAT